MAKRGGFPGGMSGNMNNLMKQAQRMQRQMEEAQQKMEETEVEATAGGGAVTVKVSGKKELISVKLQEEVVDPDDIEMLEDLIVAATNEALRKIEEMNQANMAKFTGGMGGFGGFGGGFGDFGGFDGYGSQSTTSESGDDMYFNAAARYIQNQSYDEALNVLKSISNHNGKWYYYSALAHYGKGNQATALEHIQRAMNIEPNNIEYQQVYSQMKNGSNWYNGMGRTYTVPNMGGNGFCLRLCLANLLCNLCCGGRFFCC